MGAVYNFSPYSEYYFKSKLVHLAEHEHPTDHTTVADGPEIWRTYTCEIIEKRKVFVKLCAAAGYLSLLSVRLFNVFESNKKLGGSHLILRHQCVYSVP